MHVNVTSLGNELEETEHEGLHKEPPLIKLQYL